MPNLRNLTILAKSLLLWLIFTVTCEGDKRFLEETGGTRFQVFAESETKYFVKGRTWTLVFTKREGQAAERSIVESKYTFPSKRIK